jgi:hypothetical protein
MILAAVTRTILVDDLDGSTDDDVVIGNDGQTPRRIGPG